MFLGYFVIFAHDPVPNDSNMLCIILHMGITATGEICIVSFIGFHPTKTHLEGGNYYAAKFLFSNCVRIAIISTLNMLLDNAGGPVVCDHVQYCCSKWNGNEKHCVPYITTSHGLG